MMYLFQWQGSEGLIVVSWRPYLIVPILAQSHCGSSFSKESKNTYLFELLGDTVTDECIFFCLRNCKYVIYFFFEAWKVF